LCRLLALRLLLFEVAQAHPGRAVAGDVGQEQPELLPRAPRVAIGGGEFGDGEDRRGELVGLEACAIDHRDQQLAGLVAPPLADPQRGQRGARHGRVRATCERAGEVVLRRRRVVPHERNQTELLRRLGDCRLLVEHLPVEALGPLDIVVGAAVERLAHQLGDRGAVGVGGLLPLYDLVARWAHLLEASILPEEERAAGLDQSVAPQEERGVQARLVRTEPPEGEGADRLDRFRRPDPQQQPDRVGGGDLVPHPERGVESGQEGRRVRQDRAQSFPPRGGLGEVRSVDRRQFLIDPLRHLRRQELDRIDRREAPTGRGLVEGQCLGQPTRHRVRLQRPQQLRRSGLAVDVGERSGEEDHAVVAQRLPRLLFEGADHAVVLIEEGEGVGRLLEEEEFARLVVIGGGLSGERPLHDLPQLLAVAERLVAPTEDRQVAHQSGVRVQIIGRALEHALGGIERRIEVAEFELAEGQIVERRDPPRHRARRVAEVALRAQVVVLVHQPQPALQQEPRLLGGGGGDAIVLAKIAHRVFERVAQGDDLRQIVVFMLLVDIATQGVQGMDDPPLVLIDPGEEPPEAGIARIEALRLLPLLRRRGEVTDLAGGHAEELVHDRLARVLLAQRFEDQDRFQELPAIEHPHQLIDRLIVQRRELVRRDARLPLLLTFLLRHPVPLLIDTTCRVARSDPTAEVQSSQVYHAIPAFPRQNGVGQAAILAVKRQGKSQGQAAAWPSAAGDIARSKRLRGVALAGAGRWRSGACWRASTALCVRGHACSRDSTPGSRESARGATARSGQGLASALNKGR